MYIQQTPLAQHDYYMKIAYAVSDRANCIKRKVGAVIVREDRIIATGVNGTPEGQPNCLEGGCHRCTSGESHCICVHAEMNAILSAARFGVPLQGATLYTTTRPCFDCTKAILQLKLSHCFYKEEWNPHKYTEQYFLLQNNLVTLLP